MFMQGGIFGKISEAFPAPSVLSSVCPDPKPNCASHKEHRHPPALRILPSSQFFCSLWSYNYIFLNAVLSTVVVEEFQGREPCMCCSSSERKLRGEKCLLSFSVISAYLTFLGVGCHLRNTLLPNESSENHRNSARGFGVTCFICK